MPRSHWKGTIEFGLVSIPIALFPSENKTADISFHQIDRRDNARIKYQRVNANTGKEVPWDDISRGYEYAKDEVMPVPDEMLKKVAGDNAHTIEIENFINIKDLDLLMLERAYYIIPEKKGIKGYVILREALTNANKIGIAKVIITTKEYLACVMGYQEGLILWLLKYDNEVKKMAEFDIPNEPLSTYKITSKEIEIAKQLIKSMSSKWKPKDYVDEYQEALHKWVEASLHKKSPTAMKKRGAGTKKSNVIDFVSLLKESLKNKPKGPKKGKHGHKAAKKAHR